MESGACKIQSILLLYHFLVHFSLFEHKCCRSSEQKQNAAHKNHCRIVARARLRRTRLGGVVRLGSGGLWLRGGWCVRGGGSVRFLNCNSCICSQRDGTSHAIIGKIRNIVAPSGIAFGQELVAQRTCDTHLNGVLTRGYNPREIRRAGVDIHIHLFSVDKDGCRPAAERIRLEYEAILCRPAVREGEGVAVGPDAGNRRPNLFDVLPRYQCGSCLLYTSRCV